MYPADVLAERRVALGSRAFTSLYQQAPISAEGHTFRRSWLSGRYDQVPDKLEVVTAVDSSYGEGTSSTTQPSSRSAQRGHTSSCSTCGEVGGRSLSC
jgi:hypothetical protein